LDDITDLLEALAEVCRHAGDVPTKTKSNFFVVSPPQFQRNSGGDTIRMGDNTEDVYTKMVGRIRIGPAASLSHNFGDVVVSKERRAFLAVVEDSNRLPLRGTEEISAVDAADCCRNWIQDGIPSRLKLADAKVGRTLVEAEADMNGDNFALPMECHEMREWDELVLVRVEGEVGSQECQSLPSRE
jgi:hypothetical protein